MAAAAVGMRSSRARKASMVSFEGTPTTVPSNAKPKLTVTYSDARQSSAASTGTATTWAFTDRPAASILVLRNRIFITLEKVLKLLDGYEQKYLTNVDDDLHGVYQEFVKQLLAKIGHKGDLNDCEQLESVILNKFNDEPAVIHRLDYKALQTVSGRTKAFENMKKEVQLRLDEVYSYANTFCVTFADEAGGYSFKCIENYENIKTESLREINTSLDGVRNSVEELETMRPLSIYLEHYSKVIHYLENIVKSLRSAALGLKKWIIADEQYEKSMEKEAMFLKQKRHQIDGDHMSISSASFEVKARGPCSAGMLRQLEINLAMCTEALHNLKHKLGSLNKKLEDVQENSRETRRELVHIEKQMLRRQTPEAYTLLVPAAVRFKQTLADLQESEDALFMEQTSTKELIADMKQNIHTLENDLIKRRRSDTKTKDMVVEQKATLKQRTSGVNTLAEKLRVLQKLASLKKNPVTLRQIQFHIVNLDYKEAMLMAIQEVSKKVGSHWPAIYSKLTFVPPRSPEMILVDIETIQRAGLTTDKCCDELAYTAFERWARRSVAASISELMFVARGFIEKSDSRQQAKKVKANLSRPKKRFHQLRIKPNVTYV